MPKAKTTRRIKHHKVVSRKAWLTARLKLLKVEKELTRRGDEVARMRQGLPWVRIDKNYRFETEEGRGSLLDLFKARSQLVVYHFMFGPDYSAGCPACSATADSFNGILPHLEARDVTMICISRAPLEKLLAFRKRMGWNFNWASSQGDDFNLDFGVSAAEPSHAGAPLLANEVAAFRLLKDRQFRKNLPPIVALNARSTGTDVAGYMSEGHGFSVFTREGDKVYHSYSSYARGTEFLMVYYAILDRVPKGRDEEGPMGPWLRRHDEYHRGTAGGCGCA
ncbi:MAG TPA: DUF899 domain-containing protein [Candidatus Acidoferrales bacterium]|nr:DUF899 domain-containing protein [Candidatus Acidoferrales bacterium]